MTNKIIENPITYLRQQMEEEWREIQKLRLINCLGPHNKIAIEHDHRLGRYDDIVNALEIIDPEWNIELQRERELKICEDYGL